LSATDYMDLITCHMDLHVTVVVLSFIGYMFFLNASLVSTTGFEVPVAFLVSGASASATCSPSG
jgi:hypothetical protein